MAVQLIFDSDGMHVTNHYLPGNAAIDIGEKMVELGKQAESGLVVADAIPEIPKLIK